jgi:replicative DNA helicase
MTSMEPENIPTIPYDLNAERAVIGSVLLDRTLISIVADWLEPAHFYVDTFRAVYQVMVDLYRTKPNAVPADYVTIGDKLKERGLLHLIDGDAANLTDYAMATPTSTHIVYYADIVSKHYLRRYLIEASADIAANAYTVDDNETLIERVNRITEEINRKRNRSLLIHAEQASQEWRDQLGTGGVPSIPTGITSLDETLGGGLHPKEYVIVAARPSVGKSWLGLHILHHITKYSGRVLYASYEMPREDLWSRLVAIESGVSLARIREPRLLSKDEYVRVAEADGLLSMRPIVIADDFGATMDTLQAQAMHLQNEHGEIACIVVDYLQLVNTPTRRGDTNRQNEVSELSRGIKRLAGMIGCPVVALSQLNRSVESRSEKVPMLSDLRESGSLEQDADVVMFIHREEIYDPGTKKKGIADLHIAKQRNGPLARVSCQFNPVNGRWASIPVYAPVEGY